MPFLVLWLEISDRSIALAEVLCNLGSLRSAQLCQSSEGRHTDTSNLSKKTHQQCNGLCTQSHTMDCSSMFLNCLLEEFREKQQDDVCWPSGIGRSRSLQRHSAKRHAMYAESRLARRAHCRASDDLDPDRISDGVNFYCWPGLRQIRGGCQRLESCPQSLFHRLTCQRNLHAHHHLCQAFAPRDRFPRVHICSTSDSSWM